MELWDAYNRDFKRIEGMTLIRGEAIPAGVYHLVCDIIVRHRDGSYLLMQRDQRKHFGGMWEATSGGSALKGEDAAACAARELREETGIESDALTEVGRVVSNDTVYVEFLCETDWRKDSIVLQEGETSAYRWVSKEELLSMKKEELITERMQGFIDELKLSSKDTERDGLQIYIPRTEDSWFYVKMLSDPETMAYNAPWFPPDGCIPDPEAGWENIMSFWIGCEDRRFYAFLRRTADGAFVGDVNYHYDPEHDRYDMGILIYAPERGKGYGKQGLQLLLDRAFRVNKIAKLHNDFETSRSAAYAIHKDAGFTELGTKDGIIELELKIEDYLTPRAR